VISDSPCFIDERKSGATNAIMRAPGIAGKIAAVMRIAHQLPGRL